MEELVGLIGTGIMGSGMLANLKNKGAAVRFYGRDAAKAAALGAQTGAEHAPTIRALCAKSNLLLLCVTDTCDVAEVLFGHDGAMEHLRPGSLVVDCSTISPADTREFAARLRSRNIGFVDAPVSGGSEGAIRGTLAVMAGGSEPDFRRARPVLEAIGSRIVHVGDVGDGQTTKLLNQVLVVVNMLAVSEALLLGSASGVDLRRSLPILEVGAGGSWMLSNRAPQILDDYWAPGFTIDLQQKDLRLVLELGQRLGVPLFATGLISQLYSTLQRNGNGSLGNHALIRALEPLSASSADLVRGSAP